MAPHGDGEIEHPDDSGTGPHGPKIDIGIQPGKPEPPRDVSIDIEEREHRRDEEEKKENEEEVGDRRTLAQDEAPRMVLPIVTIQTPFC